MTTSDDVYAKLANVTQQLGEERTRNEQLVIDNQNLRSDLQSLLRRHNDLCREVRMRKDQEQRSW